jgi:uncharacterized PurR-regulated membrane protein YhhQ (DUF165 family)
VTQHTNAIGQAEAFSHAINIVGGVSTMGNAAFSANQIASSPAPTIFGASSKRRSIFVALLEALHHSRWLQAQRTLKQYDHLIQRHRPSLPEKQ